MVRLCGAVLAALLSISIPSPVLALGCAAITDPQAQACCAHNAPRESLQQKIRLSASDDRGTLSEIRAELFWKRFKDGRARARIDLQEPAQQSGTVVLLTERESESGASTGEPEAVLYKPGKHRDRLVTVSTLSGELFGTDFSYEDFAHFYGTNEDVTVERLEDAEQGGHRVLVLQSQPADPELALEQGATYTRIVSYLDAERCVPLLTRFFEDDTLRKELTAAETDIYRDGERWLVRRLLMHDLADGTSTVLTVDKSAFEPALKDRFFRRSSLKRGIAGPQALWPLERD